MNAVVELNRSALDSILVFSLAHKLFCSCAFLTPRLYALFGVVFPSTFSSTLEPLMTPLRQRLTDDLRIRNYAPRTITTYLAAVARFAQHFRRSPDTLQPQHVRQYQLHLLQQHASWSRFNQTVAALRFFYHVTLQRDNVVTMIPYGKNPNRSPPSSAAAKSHACSTPSSYHATDSSCKPPTPPDCASPNSSRSASPTSTVNA